MGGPDGRVLLLLAVDQRNSFERGLYGLKGPISAAQDARMSADKLLVYEALVEALPELPAEVQAGILVDEQYGASVAELASRSEGVVSLAMPIEKSGEDWFEFNYGEDWVAHAEFFATDHAKVLVRDNPGFDPTRRERQATQLAQVSRWASSNNRSLIIELLVPATDADTAAVSGDPARYDRELRPEHAVTVMEYLQDQGVEPAIWKVEGLDRPQDAERIVDAAQAQWTEGGLHSARSARSTRSAGRMDPGGRADAGMDRIRHRPQYLVGRAHRAPPWSPFYERDQASRS